MNKKGKGGFNSNPQNINRNGKPKGIKSIPDILRKIGKEKQNEVDNLEAVMRKVYALALKGTRWAVELICDRTEGKTIERIITSEPDEVREI